MNDTLLNDMIEELKNNNCIINVHDIEKNKFKRSDNAILLKYLGKFEGDNYNKLIVRCLGQKGIYELSEPLINEFVSSDNSGYRWTIANSLLIISDLSKIDTYLSIIKNKKFGSSRQMLVLLIGKCRQKDCFDVLMQLLDERDHDVLPHVLIALKKRKDKQEQELVFTNVKKFYDDITSDDGKQNFISELTQIKSTNPEYEHTDIKGYYSYVLKLCRKIIDN